VKKPSDKNNLIESLESQLESRPFVELPSKNPLRDRDNLYDSARRRGKLWRFATTEKSVFVVRR
jgi:hypothetical protein